MKFNRENNLIIQANTSDLLEYTESKVAIAKPPKLVIPKRPDFKEERGLGLFRILFKVLGIGVIKNRRITSSMVDATLKEPTTSSVRETIFISEKQNPDCYLASRLAANKDSPDSQELNHLSYLANLKALYYLEQKSDFNDVRY